MNNKEHRFDKALKLRLRDYLIAEKVMGLTVLKDADEILNFIEKQETDYLGNNVVCTTLAYNQTYDLSYRARYAIGPAKAYSTRIEDTFEVVKKLNALGYTVYIDTGPDRVSVSILTTTYNNEFDDYLHSTTLVTGETVEETVCKAALSLYNVSFD